MQVHCQQRDLRPTVFGGMIRYSLRSAKDIVFSCFFNWGFWRWSLEPRISIVETNIFQATPFYSEFQLLFFQGFGNHRWYTELGILFLLSTVVACCPLNTKKSLQKISIQALSETYPDGRGGFLFCSLLPRTETKMYIIQKNGWKNTILQCLIWNGPLFPKDICQIPFFWGVVSGFSVQTVSSTFT